MTLQGLLRQGMEEEEPVRSPSWGQRGLQGGRRAQAGLGGGLSGMGTLPYHPLPIQAAARLLFGSFPLPWAWA